MAKKRVTLETAESIVDELIITKNLIRFIKEISDEASWFGRFGRNNRLLFTNDLVNLLEKYKIRIK